MVRAQFSNSRHPWMCALVLLKPGEGYDCFNIISWGKDVERIDLWLQTLAVLLSYLGLPSCPNG